MSGAAKTNPKFSAEDSQAIVIASDHPGFELKTLLVAELDRLGYSVRDLGTNSSESVDYPDFANALAKEIESGAADRGVLVCGTGVGISIAANRNPAVRAALCHDSLTARFAREHNDANVLALGARVIGIETAKDCLATFLQTGFEGGRHARRVAKMSPVS